MPRGFVSRDVAAYQGKEIEVYIYANGTKNQIRGAQSFNFTEEKPETRVPEMGYDATKAVYGPASYTVSIGLLVRDLVQIARICGLDPTVAQRINVNEFQRVNSVCWYKDPDTKAVVMTKYAGGFKSRTASQPQAVEANTMITLEGAADLAASFEGQCEVVEFDADGIKTEFLLPVGTEEYDVKVVESPAGQISEDWTYEAASGVTPTQPSIEFDTAPESGGKIRIVYAT